MAKSGRPEEWTIDRACDFVARLEKWITSDQGLFWKEFILLEGENSDTLDFLQRKFNKRKAAYQRELHNSKEINSTLSQQQELKQQELKKINTFFRSIKRAKEYQEVKLSRLSLDNKSVGGAIFLLKNNHGYADKQEVKQETRQINVDAKDLAAKSMEELLALQEELARG